MTNNKPVGDYIKLSPDPTTKVSSTQLVSNSNVGIEIELEGIPKSVYEHTFSYWRIDNDGSLRDGGAEFVFRQPLAGIDVENALTEFSKYLSSLRVKPVTSDRTSVHVHLDIRDLTINQLFNLIVIYAFIEKPLMKMCGSSRMDNNYCVPLYKINSDNFLYRIGRLNDERQFTDGVYSFGESERYSACNLASIAKYGSIEFRGLHGTYDTTEILDWINIILMIKQAAISVEDSFCRDIHNNISKMGAVEVLHHLFKADMLSKLKVSSVNELRNDLLSSISTVQDIMFNYTIMSAKQPIEHRDMYKNPLFMNVLKNHNAKKWGTITKDTSTLTGSEPDGAVMDEALVDMMRDTQIMGNNVRNPLFDDLGRVPQPEPPNAFRPRRINRV